MTLGDKECKDKRLRDPITSFRSIGLKTYTIEMKKKALSFNDDKRILCMNGIDTLAIGHYKTLL